MSLPLENMCRTCMLNESKQEETFAITQMVSIFLTVPEDSKEELSLIELLKTTAPQLNIKINDQLPKIVCLECLDKIKEIYRFQQNCLNVEQKYYKMLEKHDFNDQYNDSEDDITDILKTEFDDPFDEENVLQSDHSLLKDDVKMESAIDELSGDFDCDNKSDSDWEEEKNPRKMSDEHANPSKGKIKYFPHQANPNCACCKENSKRLDTFEKQQNTITEILAEHKVLLNRLVSQNASVENIMGIFPINTEKKLKEFDTLLATQSDLYKRHIKTLISGNVEHNLHQVFGQGIIMNFNVDGNFGKRRLKDFGNVFAAIIDVISSFNNSADKTLRAAFQRQKKKYFKQKSRKTSQ